MVSTLQWKTQDGWRLKQQNICFSFVYKNLILDLKICATLKVKDVKKYSKQTEPENKLW